MNKFAKYLICIILAVYIVSPVDLMTGVQIDDIAALIALISTWGKKPLEDGSYS